MEDYKNLLKDIKKYESLKDKDLKKKKSLEEEIKICDSKLKELNVIKTHFDKGIESYSSFIQSSNMETDKEEIKNDETE